MWLILFLGLAGVCELPAQEMKGKDPRALIGQVVEAMGGMQRLKELRDVEYTYTYRNSKGKEDVSLERYVFGGEWSWAKYSKREVHVSPDKEGELIQGFDGKESWVTLNGSLISATDQKSWKMADFMRKTNFYWFAMMFKLLDPGLIYSYEGTQEVEGVNYEKVKVTFESGVGDVSDIYLLYINPRTLMVDQFLFTVMDFGRKDPLLMKVDYEKIEGVTLPVRRKYAPAEWDGKVKQEAWAYEIMENVKFSNGFQKPLFQKPGA